MATPTSADRTISIPVSLATHVVIGCLIALVALAAMFAYFQLPTSHYRGVALTIAIIASAGALSYWLWCASQCLHADVRANGVAIDDARAEIRTAKAEALARLDRVLTVLGELREEIGQNRGAIKEHTDAVDANTAAVTAMTKALNVLRECYLQEGVIQQDQPKEAPRKNW